MLAPVGFEEEWIALRKANVFQDIANSIEKGDLKETIVKYSIEYNGKTILEESFDINIIKAATKLLGDKFTEKLKKGWVCRIKCPIECYSKAGYAACVARCLVDGNACDGGLNNCKKIC